MTLCPYWTMSPTPSYSRERGRGGGDTDSHQPRPPQTSNTGRPLEAMSEPYRMTYCLTHEAWYWDGRRPHEVMVSKAHPDGGCKWEFGVRANPDINAIRAEVFDDAFAAFVEIPQFFRALADVDTLDGVIGICQRLGWADTTEREREGGPLSQPLPTGRHAVIWADTPHHGRRLLSRYDGERRDQWVCDDEGLRTSYRSEDLSRVEVAFKGVAS